MYWYWCHFAFSAILAASHRSDDHYGLPSTWTRERGRGLPRLLIHGQPLAATKPLTRGPQIRYRSPQNRERTEAERKRFWRQYRASIWKIKYSNSARSYLKVTLHGSIAPRCSMSWICCTFHGRERRLTTELWLQNMFSPPGRLAGSSCTSIHGCKSLWAAMPT